MIFRSFYARLSMGFLGLVALLGVASLFIAFEASIHLFDEVDQLLNRGYAASIAQELEARNLEAVSSKDIGDVFHYLMLLNPNVEIYLIDAEGMIQSYYAGEEDAAVIRDRIDPEPLQRFHDSMGFDTVLGDDPRTEAAKKPFSAAPIQIQGEQGWVYVILRGQGFDSSLAKVRSNYYLRSGLTTMVIAILFTLGAGYFLFFVLTNRLRSLSEAVKTFKSGDYHHRIKIKGQDELAQLGRTFNEMAQSIDEGIERL